MPDHEGLTPAPVLQISGNTWRTGHGFELPKPIFNTGATRKR
jgi:hypothetical protein